MEGDVPQTTDGQCRTEFTTGCVGCVRGALNTRNDRDAIFSIMRLKVFGSSRDEETRQRRAKVATAVLRFLKPNDSGCRRLENSRDAWTAEKN